MPTVDEMLRQAERFVRELVCQAQHGRAFRGHILSIDQDCQGGITVSFHRLPAILRGFEFGESHIPYGTRVGTVKLRMWSDGVRNLLFLVRKRVGAA